MLTKAEIVSANPESARDLSADRGRALPSFSVRNEWVFASLITAFCVTYMLWYPATFATEDECSILSLAYSIGHGSLFILNAGPHAGSLIGKHVVARFSPFHAALLVPAMAISWRLSFLVTASFFIAGAFILRKMLQRNGLGSEWCALYFFLAGALFYSQTLVACVAAAVLGLLAVSLCLRQPPRPLLAGVVFGLSVLFHPWMTPMAIVFSLVWCVEQEGLRFSRTTMSMLAGALPSIILLGLYNYFTTGNPLKDEYIITGHQYQFVGKHFVSFLSFYIGSLAIFPIAGWTVFSRRWSGTLALPAVSAVMVVMASLYFYRDGLNVGSARVGTTVALITGLVPGQRFLLPLSMIACLPAARFLSASAVASTPQRLRAVMTAAVGVFVLMFTALSIAHQTYLTAHLRIQQALYANLAPGADVVISGTYENAPAELGKEFPSAKNVYRRIVAVKLDSVDTYLPAPGAYVVLETFPGQKPPGSWVRGRVIKVVKIRSWVWNRDCWIGLPVHKRA